MPIQFECTRCRERVRVPDGSGGKKTRCPHCQAVIEIPQPLSAQPDGSSGEGTPPGMYIPAPPPMQRDVQDRFETHVSGPSTYERPPENPFASPGDGPSTGKFVERSTADARRRLVIPSIILLIFGFLSLMVLLILVAAWTMELATDPNDETIPELIVLGILLALNSVTIAGVLSATFRWNYAMAWVGFIGAMIPCSNVCGGGLLSLVVAVWGIVVLTDPAVRRLFRS